MVDYKIKITKAALKDKEKIKENVALKSNVENLLEVIKKNPFENPPPFKKLVGDLSSLYSRRINKQHRLVYKVDKEERTVVIVCMWSHYEF